MGATLPVPIYGQCWQPWASHQLGQNCGLTICDAGCALTSVAMVLAHYGVYGSDGGLTDPDDLNTWLLNSGRWYGSCGIYWADAAMRSGGSVTYYNGGSGFPGYSAINAELDKGYPVIVEVYPPGTTHFVVLVGYNGTNYTMNDPAYGDQTSFNNRWGDPTTAIKAWRYYHVNWTATNDPNYTYWPYKSNSTAICGKGQMEEVFARGYDGGLYHIWQTSANGSWSDWASMGMSTACDPVVVCNLAGGNEVFIVGLDGNVWHRGQSGPNGTWGSWASLGGPVASGSKPCVGRQSTGRLECFARFPDGSIRHCWQDSTGAWNGWASLGGNVAGNPVVMINADKRQELYVRGNDNALWHCWQTAVDGAWSGWSSLAGSIKGDVESGATRFACEPDAFAQGTDGSMNHIWQTPWSSWSGLNYTTTGNHNVTVGRNTDGRQEIFVLGSDGEIHQTWQDTSGNWQGWINATSALTPTVVRDPVVCHMQNGSLDLFVVCSDGCMYHANQNGAGGSWTGWQRIGSGIFGVPVTLTATACANGTTTGGGTRSQGEQATVTATPANGYCFSNWTGDGCGGSAILSRQPNYTFTMPTSNLTVSANFARGQLFDGFEGMAAGDVNMNNASGPNKATNGDLNSGNPWSGPSAPNGGAVGGTTGGVTPHSGTKMYYASTGYANCIAMANIAYRCNSGAAYTGGVYLDWWFYDPKGTASDSNTYQDYAALCFYPTSTMPSTSDYGTYPSPLSGALQRLSLGASESTGSGYDRTKYQARIMGTAGYDGAGWSSLSKARSVGWHHARINVGPAKGGLTNDVRFYIDDMATALLTADSTTAVGYNSIQLNCRPGSTSNATGYFDDVTVGEAPTPPVAAPSDGISTSQITWHWAATDPVDSYTVADALGVVKGTTTGTATGWTETGLTANTRYARYVSSAQNISGGQISSATTALPQSGTLPVAPVFAVAGAGAIYNSKGPGSLTAWYPLNTSLTFTAMNNFGTGATKAYSYLYVWDTSSAEPSWTGAAQWTAGALVRTSSTAGRYYLHLRACNADGLTNQTTLTLGPYDFRSPTAVNKISDAWAQDNLTDITLSGKYVTAIVGGAVWIEELDRSSAMKVVFTGYATQDHLVNVFGELQPTTPRVLATGWVQDLGDGPSILYPILMNTKYLGGRGFNSSTPGVSSGFGLYNIGLLVKVFGAVTYSNVDDPQAKYFYLDDGGGLFNATTHSGVKVLCGTYDPPTSGYVSVIGVVDTQLESGSYVPVIQTRTPPEIAPY